jgi:serine/threonine-protein kinase RsbT
MAKPEALSCVVKELTDVVWARDRALTFVEAQGFSRREAWRIAIALSELATNAVKFAGGGQITLRHCTGQGRCGIELVVEDRGPGVADPQAALVDGYSRGRLLASSLEASLHGGLGAGLGAVQRLTDELRIEPREGGGTRIIARRWLTTQAPLTEAAK